jgi:antibiotic biosynthesis monooxygenase (ABM) superfamily enzyme
MIGSASTTTAQMRGVAMPTALFTVKATIDAAREAAFNEWYNHQHIPAVMQYKGVVSARRYKAVLPEDRFQYVALYEFESEDTLHAFLASEHFAWLRTEFDAAFEGSERQRAAYVQVWP